MQNMEPSPLAEIEKILAGREPSRFVYAPNYWQWFKHQKDHSQLPAEIKHCNTLCDLYNWLGVDIFSRNVYSDPERYWFGGLCDESIENFGMKEEISFSGKNKIISRSYRSTGGILDETLTYVFNESTLVQNKFLVTDYIKDFELFRHFVAGRRWKFNGGKFDAVCNSVGEKGMVIAGEFFSPLKMMHFAMGPVNTVYFLMECPDNARELVRLHEEAQLSCIDEAVKGGVKVVMAMDNLDTMFHSPDYVLEYSSSFYTRASEICHRNGAVFFIHACGRQRDNLELISSFRVDGLERCGVASTWRCNARRSHEKTHNGFIITGGISAMETRDLKTRIMFLTMWKNYSDRCCLSGTGLFFPPAVILQSIPAGKLLKISGMPGLNSGT